MKILIKEECLDLEAPIFMSEKQKEKFIAFFKNLFPDVDITQKKEKEKYVNKNKKTSKTWSLEEYAMLLGPESNEAIAVKMKRTGMGVLMQRGSFVPAFLGWLKKKNIGSTISEEVIKEYLSEAGKKWRS